MKTAVALLIGSLATFGAGVNLFVGIKPGNRHMQKVKQPPTYTLNIERPFEFLKKHLPQALEDAPRGSIACDAMDGIAVVHILRGQAAAEMEVELITGDELPASRRYSILLSGTPATLDDTYALALRICELAKIPDDRIVAWYKEKKYESPLGSAEAQIAREGKRQHSVDVRSSLELKGDKQWRVVYTIYFPNPQGAPGGAQSDKDQERPKHGEGNDGEVEVDPNLWAPF